MDRVVRVKLLPTDGQANALKDTIAQFTATFNKVCKMGWEAQNGNAYTLHRFTYRDCKQAYPDLVSDLHI